MLIVARGGASYARLAFGVGPGGSWEIPVEIDYDVPFAAADRAAWQAEYDACVQPHPALLDKQELEEFEPARLWPREHAWCEDGYDAVFEQSV